MAAALLLLTDLATRAPDIASMHSDEGMFPRLDIVRLSNVWNWSFHFGGGSVAFQGVLFAVAAAFALALLVGFETRLSTVASWLLLISLQNRVPPILTGADTLLRMLVFWGMFLPLGRAWSVDRWLLRRRGAPAPPIRPVLSIASAAILSQMALMYFFSALFKSNANWFQGEAIAGSLAHDFYARPAAAWVLQFPAVLKVMTLGVFVLEWLGPILLFSPFKTAWLRLSVVAALALMHLGIEMLLLVGPFSFVSLAGLSLFLPPAFWDKFGRSGSEEQFRAAVSGSPGVLQWGSQALCLAAFLYVILVNINSLPSHPLSKERPSNFGFLKTACGLGQKWAMFDAAPSKDGWYVAWARLENGKEIDLLWDGAPVRWDRRDFPAGAYPNHRWQKLFREMAYDDEFGFQLFRRSVAEHLCREWNAGHTAGEQIVEVRLVYCMETPGRVKPARVEREEHLRLRFDS